MSRTLKKLPGFKDRNPFMKNYANRRLRRVSVDETPKSGKSYRMHTNPYCISDYKWFYFTKLELIERGEWMFKVYPNKYRSSEQAIKAEIAKMRSK